MRRGEEHVHIVRNLFQLAAAFQVFIFPFSSLLAIFQPLSFPLSFVSVPRLIAVFTIFLPLLLLLLFLSQWWKRDGGGETGGVFERAIRSRLAKGGGKKKRREKERKGKGEGEKRR